MEIIKPKRVDYFFVKAGELHQGVTFLATPQNTSEEEIIEIIKERGVHIVGIKQTNEAKT